MEGDGTYMGHTYRPGQDRIKELTAENERLRGRATGSDVMRKVHKPGEPGQDRPGDHQHTERRRRWQTHPHS